MERNSSALFFKSRSGNYVFDGSSSVIFAVDTLMMECIKVYEEFFNIELMEKEILKKYGETRKTKAAIYFFKEIFQMKKRLFFNIKEQESLLKNVEVYDKKYIAFMQESGMLWELILNVTENCNMRCKYCFMSEEYEYTRNRTSRMMDFETAKKAMDIFFSKQEKVKKVNPGKIVAITFYGGEPLMNYSLIKKCVEYTKKKCPLGYRFYITTNGILLKDDIVDFLVENEFDISVSVDGNREEHDRNRVDAQNNGTFGRIIKNIETLKEKYPEYQHKLHILGVYDWKTNMINNARFYESYRSPMLTMLNPVNPTNTNYYQRFKLEDIKKFAESYYKLAQDFIDNKINGGEISPYITTLFNPMLFLISNRVGPGNIKIPFLPFTSPCLPGSKVSVRVDGTFDICEKMNSTFPVGNVEEEWNYDKLYEMIELYNSSVGEKCKKCPIARYCSVCFAQCCKDHDFEIINCDSIIGTFIDALSMYVTILEGNINALDDLVMEETALVNG